MTDQEFIIVETMEKYGGSFVKHLGILFRYADTENFKKLKVAFFSYWLEYEKMANKKKI